MKRTMAVLMATGVLALAAIACGGDDGTVEPSGSVDGGSASLGVGPGISVSEALASDLTGLLLVNGYLVLQGDPEEVRLCEALAESFPPQCSGEHLLIEGLDLKSVEGIVSEGPVSWTETVVQVLGEVDGDVLRVNGLSQ